MSSKILICTFTFAPNKDGVAEAAALMAYGFAERGFEVVVVTGFLAERRDFAPHARIRVEQFEIISDYKFEGRSRQEADRMQQLIVDEKPDVVICHCWEIWSTGLAEKVFPRLTAKKILISHGYTTHMWRPNPRPPFGLGVLWRSLPHVLGLPRTMRLYDRVVFLSERRDWSRFFDHQIARLTGYAGIRVIPNGTEPEPVRGSAEEFRRTYGLEGGLAVFCVANYSPRKNQALAIRAFRRARLANATLVLIGSEFSDYAREIMRLDEELKKTFAEGRVIFLEKLDRATTMAAYQACDVFLLAALAETQPISLLEAMAAGKAFISTDTGCVREMPGGIVTDGEENLAAALVELQNDPAKRHALGATGRRAVLERFSKEKVLAAQQQMVSELLGPV